MFSALIAIIVALIIGFAYHVSQPLSTIFKEDSMDESMSSSREKGAAGEAIIHDFFQHLPGNYIVFQNIYLPLKKDGEYTEIDLIVVHEKGVFVIESKNYEGKITGDSMEHYWQKSHSPTFSQRFYNPIMQNATHIAALERVIGSVEYDTIYSIVVFGPHAELHVEAMPADHIFVMKTTQLSAIHEIIQASNARLPYEYIASELQKYHSNDWQMKTSHVNRLKLKYRRRAIS
ncbi:nuclease-related domain-containing protein [Kurthia sibirica]|uniref:NERD domain-containing protein n=1 Tax=Kurthia sibirica TaxID=202750 RepID=A0A2U3ALF1_9BACL|nr:nuclease-related domain-containing protein [Kurthia sibirica]PWI25368.1 hypothetical protein DEX24_08495 [Kurthia sibirica]GEK34616.1 hypothetical protein KSI01_21490 [Kurthia sibirica]